MGFSDAFTHRTADHAGEIQARRTNPYLFRYTERFLFEHGLKPLSPDQGHDRQSGDQGDARPRPSSRRRFSAERLDGWHDLAAIEAYPSACKGSGDGRLAAAPLSRSATRPR
ncbi:MAG: hypothetical protein MZU95_13380 [Desulfomicrobium escambiense]|nr:hypothetical protein [Desulfomicrobium escambiense]